ncbi:MAG: 3-hydroxyacyl-[acyl-carrier-protein] dehydratase [Verrucomicrobiales bacterium]|nr:3-hydroxyacyl-[acyl-carrier-protein] dehydratase [Verrucomicrobiales bacterium]
MNTPPSSDAGKTPPGKFVDPANNGTDFLAALPHGKAFRFVDEVLELTGGKSGTARYAVRGNEAFLEGHFPGNPMVPGVILIEALAQWGGVIAQSDFAIPALENLRLTAVRQAKITGSAIPGETLEIRAEVIARLGNLIQVRGQIHVQPGTRLVLQGEITLSGD